MKSCLNCIWSDFSIEKNSGLYSYEGGCTYFDRPPAFTEEVWSACIDDREELKDLVSPIFETVANDCKGYERTGIGQPGEWIHE